MSFNITIHVFTKDGDFYVADNNAGDDVLDHLVRTDPEAEVVVEDRDTHEALTDRKP
jgi:hypothetical protein